MSVNDPVDVRAKKENINDVLGDIAKVGNFIDNITTPAQSESGKAPKVSPSKSGRTPVKSDKLEEQSPSALPEWASKDAK
jgi:hypothetical protein